MLANLAFSDVDSALIQLSEGLGIKYTRYADDLTFSSPENIEISFLIRVRSILEDHRFELNESKTRFMGPNQKKEITGITLGRDGICLPKDYLNGARGWFHSAIMNPEKFVDKISTLSGTLQFILQVGGRGAAPVATLGVSAVAAVRNSINPEKKIPFS
jgi:hypothetical protein